MRTVIALINSWIAPVAAAPFIGSFLGVVIRRLPAGRSITTGRSACEACGHKLTPLELIPVISFALQRGRCRACGAPIDPSHLGVELAALAVAISAALVVHGGPFLWAGCIFGWSLLTLAWIDAETYRLPDVITLPLLVAGLAETALLEPDQMLDRALAAALAYGTLWLLAYFYRVVRKREGLGLGDAKLLAASGAWLGIVALPWVAIAGSLLALAFALLLRLRGMQLTRSFRLPFGPFLAAGAWAGWLLQG